MPDKTKKPLHLLKRLYLMVEEEPEFRTGDLLPGSN